MNMNNNGEARETSFLFQRLSVTLQRFNAVLLHNSLSATDNTDLYSFLTCVSLTAHVIAIGWTSVRPSARHTLVLCRNGSTYRQTVFTAW